MSYGLSVFKTDGSLGFSTADVTWQFLDQFVVNSNKSSSECIIIVMARDD